MHEKSVSENKGREHADDLVVDRKIILERIFGIWGGRCGLDASGSG
jgi:hypothetical protein